MTIRWFTENLPNINNTTGTINVIGQCVRVGKGALDALNQENVSFLDSTAGESVLSTWYNNLSTPAREKLCYAGRILSPAAMAALPTLTYEFVEPKTPSRFSFKEFQEAKSTGAIVFQPHLAGRFNASYSCGFVVKGGVKPSPGHVYHDFGSKFGFRQEQSACPGTFGSTGIVSNQRPNWIAIQNSSGTLFRCYSKTLEAPLSGVVPWKELNEVGLRKLAHDVYSLATSGLEVNSGLVTSLRSEANSGSFDLLTEMAEFPQTVKWLYSLVMEIITLFRKTKRQASFISQNNPAKDIGDKLTSLWMQYRYAVTPLVHSVADGLSLLEHEVVKYQSYRQGLSEKKTITLNGVDIDFIVTHRCLIKHQFGLEGQRISDVLKSNLLSTAWELVPLSWAVDWALNIGNLLSALQLPSNVLNENSCYSWRIDAALKIPMENNGVTMVNIDFYKRIPIIPLTQIGLDFSPVMNLKRSLDSMSLFWQMFLRKKL